MAAFGSAASEFGSHRVGAQSLERLLLGSRNVHRLRHAAMQHRGEPLRPYGGRAHSTASERTSWMLPCWA